MNGYKLLEDSARLIGFESVDENLKIIGLPIVNSVITELGYAEISSLSEKIGISSKRVCNVLRFGVASLIAAARGDSETEAVMSEKYSACYTKLNSRIEKVCDVLPRGDF